jgi:hypothetical protein
MVGRPASRRLCCCEQTRRRQPIIIAIVIRDTFSADPPGGDYILKPTGLTWGVDRTTGTGSVMRVVPGEQKKEDALATLLSLARGDGTDAWESAGAVSYRLIKRFRPPV